MVKGELQAPVALVSGNVSYKYVVLRAGREKKEQEKYLWERIVHAGPYKNRCLCIPKDRCCVGGKVQHSFDLKFKAPSSSILGEINFILTVQSLS